MQIFEVLNRVGKHHNFSAGFVTGGNQIRTEKEAIGNMSISPFFTPFPCFVYDSKRHIGSYTRETVAAHGRNS